MKTIKIKICDEIVTAKLIRFDKKNIIEGVKQYNDFKLGKGISTDTIDKYKDIKLCNYKDKWWIYYEKGRMTGSFNSKKKCINWFVKGGR